MPAAIPGGFRFHGHYSPPRSRSRRLSAINRSISVRRIRTRRQPAGRTLGRRRDAINLRSSDVDMLYVCAASVILRYSDIASVIWKPPLIHKAHYLLCDNTGVFWRDLGEGKRSGSVRQFERGRECSEGLDSISNLVRSKAAFLRR